MKKIRYFIGLTILLVGCKANLQFSDYKKTEKTASDLALNYFENLNKKSNIANERAISQECYPDEIYDIVLYDENGNRIYFEDLPEDKKSEFYLQWKKEGIKELEEKILSNESFKDMIEIENEAFNQTSSMVERSAYNFSSQEFYECYSKNLEKILKQNTTFSRGSSSSSSSTDVTSGNLVESSLEVFKRNYKQGRILINTCSQSETGFGYIGHASMMIDTEYNKEWNDDISSRVTVTSFPSGKGTVWNGMINGVQEEPIGYWCGNKGAQNVSILDVRKKWWSWFKKYYADATDDEHKTAVNFAISQKGKPYISDPSFVLFGMWRTDSYYCSSLVFRSWHEVSSDYNLNTNILWVAPSDLYASDRTKLIESYKNY